MTNGSSSLRSNGVTSSTNSSSSNASSSNMVTDPTVKRRRGRPSGKSLKAASSAGSSSTALVSPSLDIKEVLDTARKNFKRDMKKSTAASTPSSLSPRPSSTSSSKQPPPKSASAPASPVKPDTTLTGKRARADGHKMSTSPPKRLRRSTNNIFASSVTPDMSLSVLTTGSLQNSGRVKSRNSSSAASTPKTNSLKESSNPPTPKSNDTPGATSGAKSPHDLATVSNPEATTVARRSSRPSTPATTDTSKTVKKSSNAAASAPSPKPSSPPPTSSSTPSPQKSLISSDMKRRPSNNVSMNEVIKLRQDEGVMHLLHALPASRRKPPQMVSVAPRRPSANGYDVARQSSSAAASGATLENAQNHFKPRHQLGRPPKRVLVDQQTNYLTTHLESSTIKPCTQDELMTPHALGLIKQLPSKEYIRLWSSPSRYMLVTDAAKKSAGLMTVQTSSAANFASSDATGITPLSMAKASPSSSVSSDMSSVSAPRHQVILPRPIGWTINSKNYKDILIRTYPTFAQILISPVTTGLKNSLNANVCDELIDVLRQLASEAECRAVVVSGIGSTFCQGIDLTVLTYDSADRQRRSAENLAAALRRLVAFMLTYPKVLLAAVNGSARGAGVTLLPYFDLVFASDKATFSADYARLGQIPECFASRSFTAAAGGHLALNELLLFGKTATASEAVRYGLVSSVVWPDKFLEEIIPRVETLEMMATNGLHLVKTNMKQALKETVTSSVMEAETRLLVQNWTQPNFAKNVRAHLQSNRLSFQ